MLTTTDKMKYMLQPVSYSKSTLADRGMQLYFQLKSELDKKYNPDNVVFIEPDSGEYFVGETTMDTLKIARKRFPKKSFLLRTWAG